MKLFWHYRSGWGTDVTIVRTHNKEHAAALADADTYAPDAGETNGWEELSAEGQPGILFAYDYCPGTD